MNESTWMEMSGQNSTRQSWSQLTYFISSFALTATIVFGEHGDYALLLTVAAVGVGLFGILSFDAAQQGWIQMAKAMPDSIASTEVGKAASQTGQYNFYRATNALVTAIISAAQIIAIN